MELQSEQLNKAFAEKERELASQVLKLKDLLAKRDKENSEIKSSLEQKVAEMSKLKDHCDQQISDIQAFER